MITILLEMISQIQLKMQDMSPQCFNSFGVSEFIEQRFKSKSSELQSKLLARSVFSSLFLLAGIEPRTSFMLAKCSSMDYIPPSPVVLIFFKTKETMFFQSTIIQSKHFYSNQEGQMKQEGKMRTKQY